jgi:GNAT superfamily N-acetyltransferase
VAAGRPGEQADDFTVVNSTDGMAEELAAIQRACFPTLAAEQLISAAHYRAHVQRFPEGQFAVVTRAGRVVGCSTDLRTTVDLDRIEHRYVDAVDHNWLGTHDPEGEWLYGVDIGVLPEYRRRGVARVLYGARHALVRRLNLRGHVAGGLLRGYGQWKDRLGVEAYVARVVAGELVDPTLSAQLRCGFRVHGIIQDYLMDPSCDNKAAYIVWRNPEYREPPRAGGR